MTAYYPLVINGTQIEELQTGDTLNGVVSTSSPNTFTATQTFNGSSSTEAINLLNAAEAANIVAGAPSATQNIYINSGAVQYYTSNAANNFIANIVFSSGTTLGAAMSVGDSITCTLLLTQGSTPYYCTAVQVDGSLQTVNWQGGTAPSAGNASGIDVYTFAVIKTAATPTYTVLASLTQF
jgi:hypothetical protein